ncbi:alpha/beta fold hydrolase [Amphibacillus sp. Q70]|uniref:alpha/beta fold hydrolase n=1 Tax=Amphibacillus sp. Q70 TaxID=3453416 RepID=UPI003F869848
MLKGFGETKTVTIGNTEMDYVVFGSGNKPFIIIPGLSDGLKTVRGQALTLSLYYKQFAKEFKLYVFSRKNQLEEGYTTQAMARDQKKAMEKLGLKDAYVMGISQGGMIAQHLAIEYPVWVKKLILGVTVSKQNATIQKVITNWVEMAEKNDYGTLMIDTMKKTYTEKGVKKYRLFFPILKRIGKPKSFKRFIIQANACLSHDAYDRLTEIQCPTLVIGGDSDKVVGEHSSEEMADRIKGSKLLIYSGLGHGAYEEAKDFNEQVMLFLKS